MPEYIIVNALTVKYDLNSLVASRQVANCIRNSDQTA